MLMCLEENRFRGAGCGWWHTRVASPVPLLTVLTLTLLGDHNMGVQHLLVLHLLVLQHPGVGCGLWQVTLRLRGGSGVPAGTMGCLGRGLSQPWGKGLCSWTPLPTHLPWLLLVAARQERGINGPGGSQGDSGEGPPGSQAKGPGAQPCMARKERRPPPRPLDRWHPRLAVPGAQPCTPRRDGGAWAASREHPQTTPQHPGAKSTGGLSPSQDGGHWVQPHPPPPAGAGVFHPTQDL